MSNIYKYCDKQDTYYNTISHFIQFPISLKSELPNDFDNSSDIKVSITVELAPHTDEYDADGVRAFWATHQKTAQVKFIKCIIDKK